MNVLIVDDEPLARTRLARLVADIPGLAVIGEADNGRAALEACARLEPQVVLLDIRMPGMDGIEVARHLDALERPPAVIFTTAYGDHALEAFATHALDYLLKPVRGERLVEAIARARRLTRAQQAALAGAGERRARSHLCARMQGALRVVPVAEVAYLLADQKYVEVGHANGTLLIEESLAALEQEFAPRFLRIHRNALVARERIAGLEPGPDGHSRVRLKGVKMQPEVSRRHLAELRRLLRDGMV
jgi:two-component system response regulator AlgR